MKIFTNMFLSKLLVFTKLLVFCRPTIFIKKFYRFFVVFAFLSF